MSEIDQLIGLSLLGRGRDHNYYSRKQATVLIWVFLNQQRSSAVNFFIIMFQEI